MSTPDRVDRIEGAGPAGLLSAQVEYYGLDDDSPYMDVVTRCGCGAEITRQHLDVSEDGYYQPDGEADATAMIKHWQEEHDAPRA